MFVLSDYFSNPGNNPHMYAWAPQMGQSMLKAEACGLGVLLLCH